MRVASYTASKSGILGLTRLLANEWAARGINVNAIAPVFTLTAINRSLLAEPSKLEWVMSRIPMKRLAKGVYYVTVLINDKKAVTKKLFHE